MDADVIDEFVGIWQVVDAGKWGKADRDLAREHFTIFEDGTGHFAFGGIEGFTRCRFAEADDGTVAATFTWDFPPARGRGELTIEGAELRGWIKIVRGADSSFVARRKTNGPVV